ncbi:hypothetical protein HYDPIDRAFT_170946 [Hydnomerulius pinastri MD-312]|uniref:Uncharacterized protein n=1 Tax=Hydnomerulius pinastri MD-312 TaxID=994086 RepID=A0A0C9W8X6_9AGAM|nr:hypothetical protein HYDPIDRAFT_170946 [Hydnomerulius pinastri MD-312]
MAERQEGPPLVTRSGRRFGVPPPKPQSCSVGRTPPWYKESEESGVDDEDVDNILDAIGNDNNNEIPSPDHDEEVDGNNPSPDHDEEDDGNNPSPDHDEEDDSGSNYSADVRREDAKKKATRAREQEALEKRRSQSGGAGRMQRMVPTKTMRNLMVKGGPMDGRSGGTDKLSGGKPLAAGAKRDSNNKRQDKVADTQRSSTIAGSKRKNNAMSKDKPTLNNTKSLKTAISKAKKDLPSNSLRDLMILPPLDAALDMLKTNQVKAGKIPLLLDNSPAPHTKELFLLEDLWALQEARKQAKVKAKQPAPRLTPPVESRSPSPVPPPKQPHRRPASPARGLLPSASSDKSIEFVTLEDAPRRSNVCHAPRSPERGRSCSRPSAHQAECGRDRRSPPRAHRSHRDHLEGQEDARAVEKRMRSPARTRYHQVTRRDSHSPSMTPQHKRPHHRKSECSAGELMSSADEEAKHVKRARPAGAKESTVTTALDTPAESELNPWAQVATGH